MYMYLRMFSPPPTPHSIKYFWIEHYGVWERD